GVHEDPLFEKIAPDEKGPVLVPDVDRDDRRLASPDVEPETGQLLRDAPGHGEDASHALGLPRDDVERGSGRREASRWEAGAEEHGASEVLNVVEHARIAGDEPPDGGQRLREGPDNEIDLRLELEVARRAPPPFADDAEGRLIARRENERRLLAEERGDLPLDLLMQGGGAVHEAGPCHGGPVEGDRPAGGLTDPWVDGQAQVVVRAEHQHPLAM